MKVLITGGYGFIGSHIADKFYREGYDVFILDNLRNGNKENVIHKHRFYDLDTYDRRCEEVFKSNRFDLVIHLAGQVDVEFSKTNGYCDTKSNILGLVNMLSLSTQYKVKKFIYASSIAVYGNNANNSIKESQPKHPTSVFGTNKLLGEYYCSKWKELYNLDTVSIRLSYVYGPRQNEVSEGSVISIFLNSLKNKRPITVYGDGEQKYDFIYVEDVANAFYKLASIKYSGIMNLGSGKMTSINALIDEIEKHEKFEYISYLEKKELEDKDSCLDNHLINTVLDWIPETTFSEGISMTYEWLSKSRNKGDVDLEVAKAEKKSKTKSEPRKKGIIERYIDQVDSRSKLFPFIEAVIVFLLITFINVQNSMNYSEVPIDLSLFAIILFTALYGSRYGIYAFVLSAASNVLTLMMTNRDPLVLIYNTDFYLTMAYYVFVAFIIGYIKDKLSRDVKERDAELLIINERLSFTNNLYRDMRNVRDELQSQIINSEDSFGKIFSIVQELNTLKPDEVFAKAILVLEKLMKTNQVAIYKFNETSFFARSMAYSYGMSEVIKKSIRIEDTPELQMAIAKKDLVVNKSLIEGRPIMVMPVFSDQKIIGGIMLFKSEFENLTLSYQNYFKVIAELIASSLSRAYAYDEAIESEKYISDTCILKPAYFEQEFKSKLQHKNQLKMDFVIIKIQSDGLSIFDVSEKVDSIIRDTDCIGEGPDADLILLLGNTNEKEAQFVLDRLKKLELKAFIQEGDVEND